MDATHSRRLALAVGATLVLSACTTLNHPPERVWPAETPGAYPGTTWNTRNGEWWFPSEIGPMQIPPQGGNKGTIFYKGPSVPGPEGAPAQVQVERPQPPPPKPGVVQRVVYDRVFVDREVTAERLIFPAITFDHNSAKLDAEAHNQIRQAAAAIERSRGYNVVVEGRRLANEDDGLDADRADVVANALRAAGVASSRIVSRALGVTDPLSSQSSDIANELNRCAALQMIPADLELNPTGPPDDAMPLVPEGMRLETVRRRVEIPVPHLIFTDRLVFPNILFDYDKSDLRPESVVRADRAAASVMALDNVGHLKVVGHCDHIGSHEYNDALSVRRANAVRAQLEQQGVPASMLSAEGKGKRQPIADNESPAGRQLNRRVELHVEYAK